MVLTILSVFFISFIFITTTLIRGKNLKEISLKCPEEYPETDKGSMEKKADTDKWVSDFYNRNPKASLSELAKARYIFYVENDCVETIQKYSEMEAYEGETEQERILRETIQEEIQSTSIENLARALENNI